MSQGSDVDLEHCKTVASLDRFVAEQRQAGKVVEPKNIAARRREILIDAEGPCDDLERRFWGCVIDYEYLVRGANGSGPGATGTRRGVNRSSVRAYLTGLMRRSPTTGFRFLQDKNRIDVSYENVVVDFPDQFDADVVRIAKERLKFMNSR